MSRPNKRSRKETSRSSKSDSRRRAAPGRKKKAADPAGAARRRKTAKVSAALLLRLAEQLAKRRRILGGGSRTASSKGDVLAALPQTSPPPARAEPIEPSSVESAAHPGSGQGKANGATITPPLAEVQVSSPSTPAPPAIPQHGPNGGDYQTNNLIEIYGSLKPDGSHLLIIERKTRIKIDWLQFILLLILASHARSKAGLDSPIALRGGDYLQPTRIEEIIKQLKRGALLCGGRQLPECQNAYGADLLRNAKYDLRLRVQRKNKNPNLLDRGDGAGYRISTPPSRIKITLLVDGADDLVYGWQE